MLISEKNNLTTIKYYGSNDLSTNWFINEFQKNETFIFQLVQNYKDYEELLNKDFILGFYLLNLLSMYEDILNNKFKQINQIIKNNYIQKIKLIINNLKLKTTKHAIKVFQNWALYNLNNIFKDNYSIKINTIFITYEDVLKFFIEYSYLIDEKEISKVILLIEKDKRFYSSFLNSNLKGKNIIENHFRTFIETSMKNQLILCENLELINSYIILIKKDNDYSIKSENIIAYCKNQINLLTNPFSKLSIAELFINLVNSHTLKIPSTKDLRQWFETLQKESFKSFEWKEFSLPNLNDKEHQEQINQVKKTIKNDQLKNLFYDSKNKTSFWYEKWNKDDFFNLINNNRGSYSQNSINPLETTQLIKTNLFLQIFFDKEIFKIYTNNLADILECVLYDLGVSEEERNFCLERYYEIIDQLYEEQGEEQNKNSFSYMKKNALLLTAIEDTIKIFIKKIEKENFTVIKDIENTSLGVYLGSRTTKDFKLGTEFNPSNYIPDILSEKAKIVLDYYLYSPILNGGKEIRNPSAHGSYKSKDFFNRPYFIIINTLFFQILEELTGNYIETKIKKVNWNKFFKNLNIFECISLDIPDFINKYQVYLKQEFQKFIKNNMLNISDYPISFKVNYIDLTNETDLEIEIYKQHIIKFKGNGFIKKIK